MYENKNPSNNKITDFIFLASSFCDEHSTDTQHSDVRLSYDCFEQVLYDSDKSMAKRFTSSCSSNLFDSVDNEVLSSKSSFDFHVLFSFISYLNLKLTV